MERKNGELTKKLITLLKKFARTPEDEGYIESVVALAVVDARSDIVEWATRCGVSPAFWGEDVVTVKRLVEFLNDAL